jgi:AraC-like DNA-binding protein
MKRMILPPPQREESTGAQRITFPSHLGAGVIDCFRLNSGMNLMLMDFRLHQTTILEYPPPFDALGIDFFLSGFVEAQVAFKHRSFTIKLGQNAINYAPGLDRLQDTIAAKRVVRVGVTMERDQLAAFADQDGQRLPGDIFDTTQGFSRLEGEITPAMRGIIYQTLQSPFQGMTRNIFMESKALELLALKLEQLQAAKKRGLAAPCLKRADLERVRHAASLLAGDFEKTPDLNELARAVGMCRSKLHRCFRMAYGITPFDYLRNRRLETAMLYLKEGEMNVTEAAYAVGYSSPSYFTKAFKKYFGCLPGQCCNIGSLVN